MKFTGNVLFNVFPGDAEKNINPMTRAITMIGGDEFAIYLNEMEGGVIAAAHRVEGREGVKPIVNRNPIAQCVCDEIEGLEGSEYAFTLALDNGYVLDDFVVSEVRTNKNNNDYRLAQPLAIAKVRAKSVEKKPAAPTEAKKDATNF